MVITTGHPRRVYTADTYNGLTLDGTIPAHTVVDISSTWTTKQRALAAHASQPIDEYFDTMAETLARPWDARIGVTHAENFVPLPVFGRLPSAVAL